MLIASPLSFDEALHEYRVNDIVVPSVTQIMRPIRPDFSMVDPEVLERKRALGTAVHFACELDDLGELDEENLGEVLRPYLAAWRKFKAEQQPEIILNERKLHHPGFRFAGTLDRALRFGGSRWTIDLKTSTEPHAAYGVQTAAYEELQRSNALLGADEKARRATLHLDDDGNYRLREHKNPNDWPAFMACLTIFNWSNA